MRRGVVIGIGLGTAAAVALAVVALLVAEGLLFDGKPRHSDAWADCAGGDVCVTVAVPCGWTAVNRRHRDAAEAYYSYAATVMDLRCSATGAPAAPPPASCRAGRCAVE